LETNPQTKRIYVSCYNDGTVWVLQDESAGVENLPTNLTPLSFNVYPNPFTNRTEFIFNLSDNSNKENASFCIYNINGQLIKSFSLGNNTSSPVNLSWDGKDSKGRKLSPGIYFGILKVGDNKISKKVIRLGNQVR
jgi:hypothetical protein